MADHHDRIRKLRAKADSTTFPAEAESLRAKADELAELYGDPDFSAVRASAIRDDDLFVRNLFNIQHSGFGRVRNFSNVAVTEDASGIRVTGYWSYSA